jgi:hypothetical protein
MVEPAATAKGTVAMAAVGATKTRTWMNAPCHSHLRRFFHRRGCSFIIGPRCSATILRAEDGGVVGDDRNDDCGSNNAAIIVVQHVSMRPTSRGGGGAVIKGCPCRTTDWKLSNVANMLATCRPDGLMSAHFADMPLSWRHKTDLNTTFLCRGWPTFTPFFF